MLKASYKKYILHFKRPSGTSRGILTEKETYFIRIWDDARPETVGLGECPIFRGLSREDCPEYEERLSEVCRKINDCIAIGLDKSLKYWSSIRFGVETALKDLSNGGGRIYYDSDFTKGRKGIRINGLVWMGKEEMMAEQIDDKLDKGFSCIKLKIGAIDFDREIHLVKSIRDRFSVSDVELRVDANGAFSPENAMEKLETLSHYDIHSIEQPIKQGQWTAMAELVRNTPVPIALDEELIGVEDEDERRRMLDIINPQYIILKPALCGGLSGASQWIKMSRERNIGWWVTSALESNVGLNALAQWTATLDTEMPQGLGTGSLYTNNIDSPLYLDGEKLYYHAE